MFDILCNCFNSLTVSLILIIVFLFYLINKKSRDEFNKKQIEESIESIERRSEECPQQYPNGWLPVYDSHDLKKGGVKSIFALGRDLVIYRGTSGRVYVFDAYCPHLGANLGVGGTVVGDDIKCHFHGWQFNNQGECKHIPGLEDKAIPKTSIKKWRCDDVNDMIYVWHHLEDKDPDWFIPKNEQIQQLKYQGKLVMKINSHIQDIIENEADVQHFPIIHTTENTIPYLLQKLIKLKFIHIFWKSCDAPNTHCSQMSYNLNAKIGFLGLPAFKIIVDHYGPASNCSYIYFQAGTNPESLFTFNSITLGKLKQLVLFKSYSKPTILGYLLSKAFLISLPIFIKPDENVWNHKMFRNQPIFTKLDEKIIQLRRWYKQFY